RSCSRGASSDYDMGGCPDTWAVRLRERFTGLTSRKCTPALLFLFSPPTLGECSHRVLARRGVAVRRRAILVVAVDQRPQPWLAYWRCRGFYDAADHCALTQHVVVVIAPLAEQAGSRRAFEDQVVLVHVPPSFRRDFRHVELGVIE